MRMILLRALTLGHDVGIVIAGTWLQFSQYNYGILQ